MLLPFPVNACMLGETEGTLSAFARHAPAHPLYLWFIHNVGEFIFRSRGGSFYVEARHSPRGWKTMSRVVTQTGEGQARLCVFSDCFPDLGISGFLPNSDFVLDINF